MLLIQVTTNIIFNLFETMSQKNCIFFTNNKCWKRGNAMSIKFDMLTHRVWKKMHPTHLFYITVFHPPHLFKSPCLIFLNNFLPTTFIQDPSFIRDIRVLTWKSAYCSIYSIICEANKGFFLKI